jgi:hypothetical protein
VKTLAELRAGLPAGLSREEALAWLRGANETIEAAVGLIATPEQMRKISSDDWHRLKEANPVAIGDLVREAHRQFRQRYPD